MSADLERLKARFEELDALPYTRERIEGHLAMLAETEAAGDPSFYCKLLIWISDDYMETEDRPRMVEFFDLAWAFYLKHRTEIDEFVCFNLRTTYGYTIDALDLNPDVPDKEVLERLDVMEAFYAENGYSMRAPLRARFRFHSRRGAAEQATELVEKLIAEPGDFGARCDANGPMIGAQWYQGEGKNRERAAELWHLILELPDQRCPEDHRAQAFAELMFVASLQEDGAEARRCHRAGYPLVRRVSGVWRYLDLHMIYANRARDVADFMRIVHDHIDLLDASLEDDDVAWYRGRILQFLMLLCSRGHGNLPITLANRSETTADQLRARLDAELTEHVATRPDIESRERHAEWLKRWRERRLDKLELPAEQEGNSFWESTYPPVPAPWAAPPNLADLPKGWSAQDRLLAEARVLEYLGHPHRDGAWAAVAALGTPRSLVDQARLAAYRSDVLVREHDYAGTRAMRVKAVELYEQAGWVNDALLNRILAALAAFLTKDRATAFAERDSVVAQAHARHEAGFMTDGELLPILVEDYRMISILEIMTLGEDPNKIMDSDESNVKFAAANDLYLKTRIPYAPWGALLDAWAFYRAQMSTLYRRYGMGPHFVRDTPNRLDFWYGKSRDAYRDAMLFDNQAEEELRRGENLFESERFDEAERAAREADRLCGGLRPSNVGPIKLLIAESVARLANDGSRDGELLSLARDAAGLLAGTDDEHKAAHARILIADVHRRAGEHEKALDVYNSALRVLDDEWNRTDQRPRLCRLTAGRIVSLRLLGRHAEAQALLAGLEADLPDWNQISIAMILLEVGRAFQALGGREQALADFGEVIRMQAQSEDLEPRYSALVHSAELNAAEDPRRAMDLVDEAVTWIGAKIDEDVARIEGWFEKNAERHRARGEEPKQHDPVERDATLVARQAVLKTRKIPLLIEQDHAPDEVLQQLLRDAYASALDGNATLMELARAADKDDPRREQMIMKLGTSIHWVGTTQGTLNGDLPGAAERFIELATLAEECGFADISEVAKESAQAMSAGVYPGSVEPEE